VGTVRVDWSKTDRIQYRHPIGAIAGYRDATATEALGHGLGVKA
jgi:hypothetical protein